MGRKSRRLLLPFQQRRPNPGNHPHQPVKLLLGQKPRRKPNPGGKDQGYQIRQQNRKLALLQQGTKKPTLLSLVINPRMEQLIREILLRHPVAVFHGDLRPAPETDTQAAITEEDGPPQPPFVRWVDVFNMEE